MISADPSTTKYPSLSSVGKILLLTSLPYFAVGFLFQIILAKWLLVLGELALLLPAYIFLRRKGYNVATVLRLKPVSKRIMFLSFILGLAVTVLAMELNFIVEHFLPFPQHLDKLMKETLIAHNWHDWVILVLASVVLAGLLEEMLFRGLVQNAFEQRHRPLFAIFSTAVLFGAVHLNPWWFLQLIFIAMFLGVLAWRSESVLPSALIHAQNNAVAILLINFGEERFSPWLNWRGHVHPIILLLALVLLAVGLHFFFRFCEEETRIPTLLNTPLN